MDPPHEVKTLPSGLQPPDSTVSQEQVNDRTPTSSRGSVKEKNGTPLEPPITEEKEKGQDVVTDAPPPQGAGAEVDERPQRSTLKITLIM